jgi:GAF domain-containing protein/HAMP domain-containing protein
MSEAPRTILAARVTNIRARLIGNLLIILALLFVAAILYVTALSRMDQADAALKEEIKQANALTGEQWTEIEAAHRAMREVPMAWGLVIAATVLGTTLVAIRSIAQPVEQLTEVAARLAAGHLEERLHVEWTDEFGRLAAAFNDMGSRLQASYAELEQRVAERTRDLERRSVQLEAAARVAREAAVIQDIVQLLDETVRLISNRFRFYHAGIFLLDDKGEYAVLHAASSEGGQRMLARGHRLRVGQEGIVGYVTGRGEPRIALDVGADAVYFDNPDMPETRSEMALPLRARGEIIGALDVQSTEPNAFSHEDAAVLQTLADQVAMAISNVRLFQQSQESLEAMQRAYGELSVEAWRELIRARPELGERYDPQSILPTDSRWRENMKLAVHKGETVLGRDRSSPTLATPIRVRDQIIGVLEAYKPTGVGEWTPEQIALLETLTDQLGVALESARLYEESQRRAVRERLAGEVTARIRETLDVETVLKTAVEEVRQAMELPEVVIRLTTRPAGDDGDRVE